MSRTLHSSALKALAAAALVASCNQSTSPGTTQPVTFRMAAASQAAPATVGPLSLTGFRLVIGEASLGAGGQFGCVDCQGGGSEGSPTPALVNIPLDGSAVEVATEQVQAGSYSAVEIGLARLAPAVVATTPGWPADATIEVQGTFAGQSFTLPLAIDGTFQEQLAAPVVVGTSGTPATIQVGITLPVSSWFTGTNGSLDPSDPAQLATIQANARKSFAASETTGTETSSAQ
jgi:hypothetical protein